jgi:hypothetical protein
VAEGLLYGGKVTVANLQAQGTQEGNQLLVAFGPHGLAGKKW